MLTVDVVLGDDFPIRHCRLRFLIVISMKRDVFQSNRNLTCKIFVNSVPHHRSVYRPDKDPMAQFRS